jgi:hypothetical protein
MIGDRKSLTILRIVLFATLTYCGNARADESVRDTSTATREDLRAALLEKERQITALTDRLIQLEARLDRIESAGADFLGSVELNAAPAARETQVDASEVEAPLGTKIAGEQDQVKISKTDTSHPQADDDIPYLEQDRLIRSALENTLIERGGLLLPLWAYSIEPSLSYIQSSSENIVVDGFTIFPVLVVGDIVSERVVRDLTVLNLTYRLGLPWNTQFELRIPYGHQKFRSFSADGAEEKLNDNGVGDIEIGLSTQLYQGQGRWPDVEASLRYKFDSGKNPFDAEDGDIFVGTGYDSFNVLLTAVKVNDPVVYFGGIDYTLNQKSTQSIGRFDPGDSWGFNLGMALALNLNNSVSFAYDQHFTQKSRLDGVKIPGSYSTTGVFSIGSAYLLTDTSSVDFSVGIGITEDSPDLLVTLTLPFRGRLKAGTL